MAYPSKVNVNVSGFGVSDGQDMDFDTGSSPPSYSKDPDDPSSYDFCLLRQNSAATDWDLIVSHGSSVFIGSRSPAGDDPTGTFSDSTNTASVTDIS